MRRQTRRSSLLFPRGERVQRRAGREHVDGHTSTLISLTTELVAQLRSILPAGAAASAPGLHTGAALRAAVKKTTAAAGGVMGLGKGKKKLGGKLGAAEKKELPVETNPERLVSHVCGSNIYTQGEDVKLQAESAYPSWLWSLNTGRAPRIEELDPTTKQYWVRVRAAGMRRNNKLRSMRRF